MISTPKNTPVSGALNVAGDPAGRAAGDQDPQPVLRHLDPLAQAGGQRGADLHDRALPADRPAGPDAQRGGERLDRGDLRPDPAAALGDREHHLGHAVPAGLPGVPVDQRAVDQPADHRDHDEEPQPEPGKVSAADAALLAELDVAGGQPGEEVDQVPERDRAQPRPGAYHQRDREQPAP